MYGDQVFRVLATLEREERAATNGGYPHPDLFCQTHGKCRIGYEHKVIGLEQTQFSQQRRPRLARTQVIGIGVRSERAVFSPMDLPVQSNGRVFNDVHTCCLSYVRLRLTRILPCALCSASGSNPSSTSASSSMTWSTALLARSVVASSVSAAGRSTSHTCPFEQRS